MIDVKDLTKVFGKTVAVDHLTFSIQPGIVTGFLGPNGAGKSTTMRLILGLDNPTSGTATIEGQPYSALQKPLTRVGALLDANWVHPNRSAGSHLKWMARSNSIPPARIGEVLDLVGLTEVAGKKAGQFSLGMKQRLGLAGALLGDPQVLLFDEPVNGLDPEGILWVRTFMRRLAAQGRTVLVSSHMLSEMAQTADHLVVIGRGELIADQPTKEFIAAATQSTVRVRSPRLAELNQLVTTQLHAQIESSDDAILITGAAIEQIGELAASAGIPLHELSPQNGSLEQAFMELTGQATEFGAHWDADDNGAVDATASPYAAAGTGSVSGTGASPGAAPSTPGLLTEGK